MKLGILGGGQLARMLALAAYPLGIQTFCFDPHEEACASCVTQVIKGEFADTHILKKFITEVDIVTYETENIPVSTGEFISEYRPLFPSVETLSIAQDRLHEKKFFKKYHIPTARFLAIDSHLSLTERIKLIADFGYPCVLKTRQFGYDGKGQLILHSESDLEKNHSFLEISSLILESFVPFEYELSLIAVRNQDQQVVFYPLTQNFHHQGILIHSIAPFINHHLQTAAEQYALSILEALNYVGVLTIEFFYDGKQLIANEMAPRVHNSGHWTIEGNETSQFEQHLRALFNLPLGSTKCLGKSYLFNLIGKVPSLEEALSVSGVHYHHYGKLNRPGRKLGHITLTYETEHELNSGKEKLDHLIQNVF